MGVYEQMFDEEENMRMNCAAYERKGRLEGLAEGRTAGLAEGRRLQSEETARRLASMGMPVEDVSKATGMTPDEVRRLLESDRLPESQGRWRPSKVVSLTSCQIAFRRVSSSARRHLEGMESTDQNGTKSTDSLSRLSWETTNAFFGE